MDKTKIITMCITNELFIMGELVGTNLHLPRRFTYIDDGTRIQLSPLPGNPTILNVAVDGVSYPIPETETILLELYRRVTDPQALLDAAKGTSGDGKKIVLMPSHNMPPHNPKLN